ncbi:MAG: dihydrofolate reductase family protein [Phycicoccus sp.]
MTTIISAASMSLDGYIAHDDNSVGPLFDWYTAGDQKVGSASDDVAFHLTSRSAEYWREWTGRLGAVVVGRDTFDYTDGWHGNHPLGVPTVVLTHEPPTGWSHLGSESFHFVTDGIDVAIGLAVQLAGDKDVGVAAGTVASQALEAGLLDMVAIDLVPVVLGSGRPYFTSSATSRRLGDPTTVIPAERVTHLVFPVARP